MSWGALYKLPLQKEIDFYVLLTVLSKFESYFSLPRLHFLLWSIVKWNSLVSNGIAWSNRTWKWMPMDSQMNVISWNDGEQLTRNWQCGFSAPLYTIVFYHHPMLRLHGEFTSDGIDMAYIDINQYHWCLRYCLYFHITVRIRQYLEVLKTTNFVAPRP